MLRLLQYTMYLARKQSTIEYIDSTKIPVCHNKRTNNHKVFKGIATIGKSSMGWFFGFKLHITCNTKGEITNMSFTPANTDDRKPLLQLIKGFVGKLFADKRYVSSKLAEQLQMLGMTLVTTPKKNMKSKLIPANIIDIILHKKRSIIESVFNLLKTKLQLVHSRHRSISNFIAHILSSILGYQILCKKPKIKFTGLLCNLA